MKEGWEYIDFKDVFPIKMGKTPPRGDKLSWDEKKETHNKWVSIADISNNEGKIIEDTKEYISDSAAEKINKVSKGSLLMSFKLSIGRMAFAGDDLYTNEAIIAIPENEKYILRFIYYYLLSYDWLSLTEGNEKVKGATLNKTSIGKIQLPVLSLIEQQSIVDYLDSAFSKIDAMKANAEKALKEAKALFQASLKEMLEPKEGWEEKILQDICSDIVDCPHTTPQKVGFSTQYPCIRTSELKGGSIDWSTMQYLDEDEYKKRVSRLVPKPNDLVYGREGTYGDAVLLPDGYSFSLGQRTMLLRPNEIYIIPRFLLYSMISPHVYQQAKAKNSGCGVGHVNVKDIKVFRIGLPTIDIQQSIVATLDSLKSKVDRLQANYDKISQECAALKQAILRQVFE